MTRKRLILVPLGVLILAAVVGGGFLFSSLAAAGGKTQFFRVRKGENLSEVLDRAERQGLIKSAAAVRLYNRLTHASGSIRAGTYELDPNRPAVDILQNLLNSPPMVRTVLIREGLWIDEVAKILDEKSVAASKAVHVAANAPTFSYPFLIKGKTLEGYLFPDTYDLPPLLGADEAVEKMLDTFQSKVYEPLNKPDAVKLRALVIIGSLIELEAQDAAERPIISGVIRNRLDKHMPLQIDASILYALKDRRRLYNKDYQLDSPYNTYRSIGLPPGPICSPGASSIRAAANPAKHSYLFYVALPNGKHKFASTYAEHLRNVSASRKAFNH